MPLTPIVRLCSFFSSLLSAQVPEDVKADRLQRVMRLGCAHALERSERYMGRVEEVLVEERNPKNAAQVDGDKRVHATYFVLVRILESIQLFLLDNHQVVLHMASF